MKRDWDKVRELLLFVEENDSADLTKCDDTTKQHGKLLLEEGYVENLSPIGGVVLGRLKWEGHDLIDSIRDESVWKETKSRLAKSVYDTYEDGHKRRSNNAHMANAIQVFAGGRVRFIVLCSTGGNGPATRKSVPPPSAAVGP